MARTTFSGPVASDNGFEGSVTGNITGSVTGNVTGTIQLTSFTVAGVPAASSNTRRLIYVSNGANGSPVLAFSNGTSWLRVDTLAAVSAT